MKTLCKCIWNTWCMSLIQSCCADHPARFHQKRRRVIHSKDSRWHQIHRFGLKNQAKQTKRGKIIVLKVKSASRQRDRQSQTGWSSNTKPNTDRKVSEQPQQQQQQHTGQGEADRAGDSPGRYIRGTSLTGSSQGAAGGGRSVTANLGESSLI